MSTVEITPYVSLICHSYPSPTQISCIYLGNFLIPNPSDFRVFIVLINVTFIELINPPHVFNFRIKKCFRIINMS